MTTASETLPKEMVQALIRPVFDRAGLYLDLAREFGSPLFVVEPETLREKALHFQSAFSAVLPDMRAYYAMKSNNLPYLSAQLVSHGLGLDVSSGAELAIALEAGATEIIFSGPGKTVPELALAAAHPDRVTLLLDSPGELARLSTLVKPEKGVLRLGIRINTNPQGLWRKFGVLPEAVPALFDQIQDCPGVAFTGFQFHSSWNMEPSRQVEGIQTIGQMLGTLPDRIRFQCAFVDIGGGYWPAMGEWLITKEPLVHTLNRSVPIETFAQALSAAVKEWIFPQVQCRICFEPGRWLCNEALHILIQVVDKKDKDLVITDAGTNTVGWERFETDYFPVLNLSRPAMEEHACQILGSLCTPHDVWGMAYYGQDIQEGDLLLVPFQGAYTYSLRQEFIKPLPRVVTLEQPVRLIG